MEPQQGRGAKNGRILLLVASLLWRFWLWMGRIEQFRQLLAPLLLLLELPRPLLVVLLL